MEFGMEFLSVVFAALSESNPIAQVVTAVSVVVGGASGVVKGLEAVAKVTPTTKDDEVVGKMQAGLSWVSWFFDKFAMNPKREK